MSILELDNNKLIITPEALGLKFFNTLWLRDKSKDKAKAYDDISYVYYYCNYKSPFFMYPPEQRDGHIKEYVIKSKDFHVDDLIKSAIDGYSLICKTPIMGLLEGAAVAIYNMETALKDKTISVDDVQKIIINLPKMIEALNKAKEMAENEQSSSQRVRGNSSLSMLESGD